MYVNLQGKWNKFQIEKVLPGEVQMSWKQWPWKTTSCQWRKTSPEFHRHTRRRLYFSLNESTGCWSKSGTTFLSTAKLASEARSTKGTQSFRPKYFQTGWRIGVSNVSMTYGWIEQSSHPPSWTPANFFSRPQKLMTHWLHFKVSLLQFHLRSLKRRFVLVDLSEWHFSRKTKKMSRETFLPFRA